MVKSGAEDGEDEDEKEDGEDEEEQLRRKSINPNL